MKKTACALLCVLAGASSAQAIVVTPPDGSAPWLGYMNVFELPSNGGGFVFGSPWGVPDLRTEFSPTTLTLLPNSIGDPNAFWYTPAGGPGSSGNKVMEANLYLEATGGALNGQNVVFQGNVLSNTFTSAHEVKVFIRDFAPDFSSVVEASAPLSSTGAFSINLDTINDPARKVQYGFQVKGVNVWITDIAPFGNMVIAVPAPGAAALVGLGGLVAMRRRR